MYRQIGKSRAEETMKRFSLLMIVSMILLSACAQKPVYDQADLDKAVTAVKDAYGEYYGPSNPIDATMLEEIVKVKASDVEAFYAEGPMFSMSVDTLIIVIAKDGKVEAVKKALEDYKYYLEHDAFNYPMNLPKVAASQVVVQGNLVAFVLLGKYDDRTDATEDQMAEFASQQVQIGVDALLEALK